MIEDRIRSFRAGVLVLGAAAVPLPLLDGSLVEAATATSCEGAMDEWWEGVGRGSRERQMHLAARTGSRRTGVFDSRLRSPGSGAGGGRGKGGVER